MIKHLTRKPNLFLKIMSQDLKILILPQYSMGFGTVLTMWYFSFHLISKKAILINDYLNPNIMDR